MTKRPQLLAAFCVLLLTIILSNQASALYDPGVGRFCSRDPLGITPDQNLQRYCNGKPLRFEDPFGLEVPPYNHSDVTTCIQLLREAIYGGAFVQYSCASALLKRFLYGGAGTCPESCVAKLRRFNWSPRFSQATSAYLEAHHDCGFSGRIDLSHHQFSFSEFAESEDPDLYYSFKAFSVRSFEAECQVSCGKASGCCCDCPGNCGFNLRIQDDYDFCTSFTVKKDVNTYKDLGYKLARCGCILEDYRKKHGDPTGGTFKVSCTTGLISSVSINSRLCYPKRSKDHPSVPHST